MKVSPLCDIKIEVLVDKENFICASFFEKKFFSVGKVDGVKIEIKKKENVWEENLQNSQVQPSEFLVEELFAQKVGERRGEKIA